MLKELFKCFNKWEIVSKMNNRLECSDAEVAILVYEFIVISLTISINFAPKIVASLDTTFTDFGSVSALKDTKDC